MNTVSRLSLIHFLLISLTVIISSTVFADQKFRLFDATNYKNSPNLSTFGFTHLPVIYEANADPQWALGDRSLLPRPEALQKEVLRKAGDHQIICLDYETWPMEHESELSVSVPKYRKVVTWARAAKPNVKYGFYALIPRRDYWSAVAPSGSDERLAWYSRNVKLRELATDVDVLFPSLYTFYDDADQWEAYAIEQIKQAKLYGKPVYVFLWPQYHNSNKKLRYQYIPREFWRRQLEVAWQHADGAVIWGGWDFQNNRQATWNPNAGWWLETKSFVESKGIYSPPSSPVFR